MRISDWSSDVCSSDLADAADLDGDRTEIGESAQGVGGDQPTLVGKHHAGNIALDDFGQLQIGHELVDHHLLPDQPADHGSILPRHADNPGRSDEHTYELQSIMRIPSAVLSLKKKHHTNIYT